MTISRRMAMAGALIAPVAAQTATAQAKLKPTGQETLGPFFPVRAPRSHDTDLTHYPGKSGHALGQVIQITGRVFDTSGRPLPQAALTVWQANAAGRYTNPVDNNPAPLDPNFLGVVSFAVAGDGSYRLRTVKPGAYPEPSGTLRTPHIHFDVTNVDYRLVTQMYFPGDPLFPFDPIFNSVTDEKARQRMVSQFDLENTIPDWALCFRFDIVLRGREATPQDKH